jgi:hypothetical protein
VQSEETCDGGACPAPPKRCAGGVNAGLGCTSDGECSGSSCRAVLDRCKGGTREGALCDGADGNDCPGGACGEVLRCADNDQIACTAENAANVCPGSTCVPVQRCTGGSRIGQACEQHDCPAGSCAPPDNKCLGGSNRDQACSTDENCPGSRCNALSRCIGGPLDARACASHSDCGVASCAAPSGRASEFPLRLILHVSDTGEVKLLKQVIQMFQNGTLTRDATDPSTFVVGETGEMVLLTDDELIPSFHGATLRDGIPVGRRLSTAAFDFPTNDSLMNGAFGCGGTVRTSIGLDRNFPTNPYRHPFHPDHDNLSGNGASKLCRGGTKAGDACTKDEDCAGMDARCEEVEEAFNIRRDIELTFSSGKKCTGGEHPNAACTTNDDCGTDGTCETDVTRAPEICASVIEGEYHETIKGLHSKPISVAGTFKLQRVTDVATLNPSPK